jgi:hypothetical protein
VKAVAIKKDWVYTAFFCLQEMGVLRCDLCGEEFVIGHPPDLASGRTAKRQADWLERTLAQDHEQQRNHAERIELPDDALPSRGPTRQAKRPA